MNEQNTNTPTGTTSTSLSSFTFAQAWQCYKEKRYAEAFSLVKHAIAAGDIPAAFAMSCTWIVYQYVKGCKETIAQEDFSIAVSYFQKLDKKADLARSLFLALTLGISKRFPSFNFAEFCIAYGIAALRDEDFEGKDFQAPDGKTLHYDSLAEKTASRLYNCMKVPGRHNPSTANALLPFFLSVKEKCKGNKFIDMYIGLAYYWAGNTEAATEKFRHILLTDPQWYIWKNMMLVTSDNKLKIAFCCKACSMVSDENFKGKLHLQLAGLLEDCDKPHAAMELGAYMATYQKNGWYIGDEARLLANRLAGVAPAVDSRDFYAAHSQKAEETVYGGISPVNMKFVKKLQMPNGKYKALLADGKYKSVKVSLGKLGAGAQIGDAFEVRLHGKTVLTVAAIASDKANGPETKKRKVASEGCWHRVHGRAAVS